MIAPAWPQPHGYTDAASRAFFDLCIEIMQDAARNYPAEHPLLASWYNPQFQPAAQEQPASQQPTA